MSWHPLPARKAIKICQTHLTQQPKSSDSFDAEINVIRLTRRSNQRRQNHLTQQPKLSDSLDITPPINSNNSLTRNNKFLARSSIHRFTGGGVL
ncbi:hypothetical protein TNCV_592801 [Trichonephila clavipes]|nr:hypothetical protein TNCV_592801 [Trichonephila clavipes]